MTESNRYKRPELPRTQPVRSFRGVFGPPAASTPPAAAAPSGTGPRPGAVPLGVDLGYRVIEEYLQQGQAFARAVFPGNAPSATPDPRKLNERIFKYASDLAAAWLEYVQTLSGAGAAVWPTPGAPAADGGGFDPGARRAPQGELGPFDLPGAGQRREQSQAAGDPQAANGGAHEESGEWPVPQQRTDSIPANGYAADGGAHRAQSHRPTHADAHPAEQGSFTRPAPFAIAIDLASKKRAEVTLDLKPGGATALCAHELRAADPALPRIGPVIIDVLPEERRVVVRLSVPDAQPAAIYNALVFDAASNLPRGTLSVRIAE